MTTVPDKKPTKGIIFKNLKIGARLLIGFGIVVLMTFLVVIFSYTGSIGAKATIDQTGVVRVPSAITSAQAQANLLRMFSNVRGYLALGEPQFREGYEGSRLAFEADLAELKRLSARFDEEDKERVALLEEDFATWSELPEQLFALRDDQLDREEAYRIFATEGSRAAGSVLLRVQSLIETQAQQEPTVENLEILEDMANFQGSFTAAWAGLRGYVTTRNRNFRGEYEENFELNQLHWEDLVRNQAAFTTDQQQTLEELSQYREEFLTLPDRMFDILEGDRYREDLYIFRETAIPLTENMQQQLDGLTQNQQRLLQEDLNRGRGDLERANRWTLIGGIVTLFFGIGLALMSRENIAGPIRRLTKVAERIKEGHLEEQAQIESRDEIGTLAETFNQMTTRLRESLNQVRHEKQRADNLLEVVIPIGIELASEKNFNRLLEKMLVEAKDFCHADAGILYLRSHDKDQMEFVIVRNDTLDIALGGTTGKKVEEDQFEPLPLHTEDEQPNKKQLVTRSALNGEVLNISDATLSENGNRVAGLFGESYQATSHLILPLKNSEEKVIGVMQLINAENPQTNEIIPFDKNLQQMMSSFSSLAVAALEAYIREQSLKREIQQLRIEIDEAKRSQEVEQIVESDFFQDLKAKTKDLRRRTRRKKK